MPGPSQPTPATPIEPVASENAGDDLDQRVDELLREVDDTCTRVESVLEEPTIDPNAAVGDSGVSEAPPEVPPETPPETTAEAPAEATPVSDADEAPAPDATAEANTPAEAEPESGADAATGALDAIDSQLAELTDQLLAEGDAEAKTPAAEPAEVVAAAAVVAATTATAQAPGANNSETTPEAQSAVKPEVKSEVKPEVGPEAKAAPKVEASAPAAAAPKPETKPETKPEPKPAPKPAPNPASGKAASGAAVKPAAKVEAERSRVGAVALEATVAVLEVVNKPLAGKPAAMKQTLGWLAVVTLFNAAALWGYLVFLHKPKMPAPLTEARELSTGVVSEQGVKPSGGHAASTTPEPVKAPEEHGSGH